MIVRIGKTADPICCVCVHSYTVMHVLMLYVYIIIMCVWLSTQQWTHSLPAALQSRNAASEPY